MFRLVCALEKCQRTGKTGQRGKDRSEFGACPLERAEVHGRARVVAASLRGHPLASGSQAWVTSGWAGLAALLWAGISAAEGKR